MPLIETATSTLSQIAAKLPHKVSAQERAVTFFREATEGLTRPCSISEIIPFVTPARLASSRCDSPCIWRTALSLEATSFAMGTPVDCL